MAQSPWTDRDSGLARVGTYHQVRGLVVDAPTLEGYNKATRDLIKEQARHTDQDFFIVAAFSNTKLACSQPKLAEDNGSLETTSFGIIHQETSFNEFGVTKG